MTIRAMLFGVLGVLGVLLTILSALGGLDAWWAWSDTRRSRDANGATDLLLQASLQVLQDRDAVLLGDGATPAMHGANPEDHGPRAHGAGHGGDAFGTAMARMHSLGDYGARDALMRAAHDSMRRLNEERAALSGEHGDRQARLQEWVATANEFVARLEELRLASVRAATGGESRAGSYAMLKHFTLVMADFARRERVAMAAFLADDIPIPPSRLGDFYGWRGRIELAWRALREASASGVGGERVQAAVARTGDAFFGQFEDVRSKVYRAGLSGQIYGLSADEWLRAADSGIAAITALQRALIEAGAADSRTAADKALRNMALFGLLLLAGLAALVSSTAIVSRRVVGPVKAMTAAMNRLASGHTEIDIPAARRNDEIGQMARAVHVFRDNAVEKQRLEGEQAEAEKRIEEERKAALRAMADQFEAEVRQLVDAVTASATELEATARSLSSMADETSRQSMAVAGASGQVSANVQTVATATEELSASIGEIARRVASSARISGDAVERASRTTEAMRELEDVTGRIGEIVTMISDIAGQTNLLALNATIEAARAGEAGKGFAVVAQEVKALANQTARATKDVGAQVSAVQDRSRGAAEAIGGIVKVVQEIGEISGAISAAVDQQGASTNEIAENVQHAARATQEVSENIEHVNGAAGQTGEAASRVLDASASLLGRSEELRGQVDRFLGEVRSA